MIKNIKFVLFFLCVLVGFAAVQVSAQTVTMTMPAANALDVGENSMIYVVFDRNVDAATVTSATFKVIGSVHGEYSGTITPTGQYILFSSAEGFAFGEKITVISSKDIGFTDGTLLTDGYTFIFTVNSCGTSEFNTPQDTYNLSENIRYFAKGDFNMDGMVDLVTSFGTDNIIVLYNDNGTFNNQSIQNFTNYNFSNICAADFDGDGDLDLAANGSSTVAIFENDGNGVFSLLSESGSFCVVDVAIDYSHMYPADMDNDGDVDLFVNLRSDCDPQSIGYDTFVSGIIYNDGNGSFGNFKEIYSSQGFPANPQVADFNNDGLLDVSDMIILSGSTLKTFVNDGSGNYIESSSFFITSIDPPTNYLIEDIDADGYLDLVTANATNNLAYDVILTFKNDGIGSFIPQPSFQVNSIESHNVAGGDFDGDGDIDLAFFRTIYPNVFGLDIINNNGDGSFSLGFQIDGIFGWMQFVALDVDGDHSVDLLSSSYDQLIVTKNYGTAERPVLYSPVNGKELDAPATPHLDCNDVAGANYYFFAIDDDADFSSPIAVKNFSSISEWDVPVELGVGTYYWHASASNTCDNAIENWSETWHIVVVSPPPPPPKDDYQIANFPNPFNPTTTISYSLLANSHVTIEVINLMGQTIKTLVDQSQEAGQHSVIWDGKNSQGAEVSSGVYFYRIQSDDFNATKKMMLLK